MLSDFFKIFQTTSYQSMPTAYPEIERPRNNTMNINFSVGPDSDSGGAVMVFTDTNGMNTTITMPPHSVRLLIDLLEVVVQDDAILNHLSGGAG